MSAIEAPLVALARRAAALPPKLRREWSEGLDQATRSALTAVLKHDWKSWARPEQLSPEGPWRIHVMLAGRGGGKTRPAAQTFNDWALEVPRLAMASKDAAMIRDVMIEGESGILACWPPWRGKIEYNRNQLTLTWPSGAKAFPVSAEAGADAARGRQFHRAWAEEVAAWPRVEETWNEGLMNAVRLGDDVRTLVTTTPKPKPFIARLCLGEKIDGKRQVTSEQQRKNHGKSDDPRERWFRWHFDVALRDGGVARTVVSKWSTERNAGNLAPGFVEQRRAEYGASRFGAQELDADLFERTGAELWTEELIESLRLSGVPCRMARVVVAVDPTRSDTPRDECGIVVVARGEDGQAYVLEDASLRASPHGWVAQAVTKAHHYRADAIVYEKNRLGKTAELTIKTADKSVKWEEVQATQGKATRAEPVSALYEQGRVHHVGRFDVLEDEMCTFEPNQTVSPNRMDALVWGVTNLMLAEQRVPLIVR